jgi:urea transport system substrate-binding protein
MGARILVVDDDDSIRELVAEILRDEGYDIVQARNGAAALQEIDGGASFDLVVLDMRMPLVDGWQFAAALEQRGAATPIVVMTAAQNARLWAEEIGAAGYIAKPFGIDELLQTVRDASSNASDRAPLDARVTCLERARELIATLAHGSLAGQFQGRPL